MSVFIYLSIEFVQTFLRWKPCFVTNCNFFINLSWYRDIDSNLMIDRCKFCFFSGLFSHAIPRVSLRPNAYPLDDGDLFSPSKAAGGWIDPWAEGRRTTHQKKHLKKKTDLNISVLLKSEFGVVASKSLKIRRFLCVSSWEIQQDLDQGQATCSKEICFASSTIFIELPCIFLHTFCCATKIVGVLV